MADGTVIEWTDATRNPIRARLLTTGRIGHFCVRVSDGYRHCYAERLQSRFNKPVRYAAQDSNQVELFLAGMHCRCRCAGHGPAPSSCVR